MKHKWYLLSIGLAALLAPVAASAHEVYVLSPGQVSHDEADKSVHLLNALHSIHNVGLLVGYSLGVGFFAITCLWLRRRLFWQKLGSVIDKASIMAPDLIRVIFGLSLIFSASHHAVFGPELPLSAFANAELLSAAMIICGVFLVGGLFTRFFALLSIIFWLAIFAEKGWYTLTYLNYLGEGIALALLPAQRFSLDYYRHPKSKERKHEASDRLSMPVARLLFGAALLYAAINVKVLHPALSLDVVNRFHLTHYFPYDPLFVVLGSALVEILFAVFYMLGLLQRVVSVAFVTFLVLSILYFKEAVWPHYLLIGLAVGIFLHRPDPFSLDYRLSKK